MVTKVIKKEGDSSAAIVAVLAIVLLLIVGFAAYSQGYFGDRTEVNLSLPNGKSISGTVRE